MLRIAVVIAFAVEAIGFAQAADVRYTLSPVFYNGQLKAVDVEMAFTGEDDGETELDLPDTGGGEHGLWRGVTQIHIRGAERVTSGGNPAHRTIKHAPGAPLAVRYRLKQFWLGEPKGVEVRPVVAPGYFHLLGVELCDAGSRIVQELPHRMAYCVGSGARQSHFEDDA